MDFFLEFVEVYFDFLWVGICEHLPYLGGTFLKGLHVVCDIIYQMTWSSFVWVAFNSDLFGATIESFSFSNMGF
jgi:hypothetical protein